MTQVRELYLSMAESAGRLLAEPAVADGWHQPSTLAKLSVRGLAGHLAGQVFIIPADKAIAEVLIENNIDITTSCDQGVCGTCLTPVLEGEPDHRDSFLTDEERARNDQMTPCCSRAKSRRLVLDL